MLEIKATPGQYPSAHEDLIWTLSETVKTVDPVTYPNYKFVADVYINSEKIATVKKVQDPETGIGVFNLTEIVRNYLTTVFDPTADSLVAQQFGEGQFRVEVTINFGEEYGYVVYPDIVTDGPRSIYNNYNGRTIGSSLVSKANAPATNQPLKVKTSLLSEYLFLPVFTLAATGRNISVSPTGGGTPYNATFTPTETNTIQLLNISPGTLNTLQPGTITTNTRFYDVTVAGKTFRVHVDCSPQYELHTLHFLNQYGGFDSVQFSKVSRRTYKIDRKGYGRLNYQVGVDGSVSYQSGNNVVYESRSVYASQGTEKMQLNTDILSDAQYVWLKELLLSPMVYIEDGQFLIPCVITNTDYDERKSINDDLTNLVIDIEFGKPINAQYR